MAVRTSIAVFHTQTHERGMIGASFTFGGQLVNAMSLINNSVIVRNNGFQESLARMSSFSRNYVRIKRTNLDLIRLHETNVCNLRNIDTSE